MADATYTIHVGPGMTIDGGPFGGAEVVAVDDETVTVSQGSGETGDFDRDLFTTELRDLIDQEVVTVSPTSKGDGVYSMDIDFADTRNVVRFIVQEDWNKAREFDPEEAAENRPVTMQRDFDRGRVYVEVF